MSQTKLDKTDTVYNVEVDEFHTYHIGEFGVWVHNSCADNLLKGYKGQARLEIDKLLSRSSPLPVPNPLKSKNGLTYKSNPKHTLGQSGNRANAGIEPRNSFELFGSSVQSGRKRYSLDSSGNIHQYTNANDGTWHWAGRTGSD